MKIAVLLTCFNRKQKTVSCLDGLFSAQHAFNARTKDQMELEVFLTDDGCTDGTADALKSQFSDHTIHILQGTGSMYWAGGMRFCWREAMKRHSEWDYYLLINDDTEMIKNLFEELFEAEKYAVEHYGQEGIISGITCAKDDSSKLTYGGDVWVNRFLGTTRRLTPNGEPQMCDFTNANILLVPSKVVDKIGIFIDEFHHGKADYDYSNYARKNGIPVLLTANFCGRCDFDHPNYKEIANKVSAMSLKERKAYFNSPIHSIADYLLLVKRTSPLRYPIVWFSRRLNLYFPQFYYKISGSRL